MKDTRSYVVIVSHLQRIDCILNGLSYELLIKTDILVHEIGWEHLHIGGILLRYITSGSHCQVFIGCCKHLSVGDHSCGHLDLWVHEAKLLQGRVRDHGN